jgi:hypothetical protein
MTATTGRITSINTDAAFLRGVWVGLVGAIVVTLAIIAAIWLAGQFPVPAQAPVVDRPAPVHVDVDVYNPIVRPGGVNVF